MTDLPPLLRGMCLAALPPGGLVAVTAFFGALGCGLVLRSAFDLANPMPVGDWREGARHLLQWCAILGLTVLFGMVMTSLSGSRFLPHPDRLGPALRTIVQADGAVLALRSAVRMLIRVLRPATPPSSIIPELDARLPVHQTDPLPAMATLEAMEPDRKLWSVSNAPGFVAGVLLVAVANYGWRLDSLCLLRLPQ